MFGKMYRRNRFLIWDSVMRKGEKRQFIFKESATRQELDSCALYTHGHFVFSDDAGMFIADRRPGTFTGDRPNDIAPGTYWQECMEDGSRWFCVKAEKEGENFHREKVDLPHRGDRCILTPEKAFLLCAGAVSVTNGVLRTTMYHKPRDYIAGEIFPLTVQATEPGTMGILLWR